MFTPWVRGDRNLERIICEATANLSQGSNVNDFKVGDRVASTNHGGGFAEYAVGPSFTTYTLPGHVSFAGLSLNSPRCVHLISTGH